MMLRSLTFLTAVGFVFAGKPVVDAETGDIVADSRLGKDILSKARRLDGKNNDMSWVAGYSIKFVKCATTTDYYGGYFGGNNNNKNNNNNNNNRNGYNGIYEQRLIHFKLCPSNSCSSCEGGADYVVDMNEFVDAYIESKLSAQEYNCERVRQNCYCYNYNDDQTCEYQCYKNAGLDYCYQNGNNNNNNNNNKNGVYQFSLQDAVECKRMEVDKDMVSYYMYQNGGNNMNQYNQYNYNGNRNGNNNREMELFLGPYCASNGKSIHMGVFMDETCSSPAPDGIYEKVTLGQSLPYSKKNLIDSSCVSCAEPKEYDNQNYYDQQDADEVTDVCERLYEASGKCETGLSIYYPNTYACEFIKSLKASGKSFSVPAVVVTARTLAGVFAATTVIFGGVAYLFHTKAQRGGVNLAGQGGQMA